MNTEDVLEFRRKEREQASQLEKIITDNYLTLCEILSASGEGSKPFAVLTPFGDIVFEPKLYFTYNSTNSENG